MAVSVGAVVFHALFSVAASPAVVPVVDVSAVGAAAFLLEFAVDAGALAFFGAFPFGAGVGALVGGLVVVKEVALDAVLVPFVGLRVSCRKGKSEDEGQDTGKWHGFLFPGVRGGRGAEALLHHQEKGFSSFLYGRGGGRERWHACSEGFLGLYWPFFDRTLLALKIMSAGKLQIPKEDLTLASLTASVFFTYMTIGLPLAVIPLYVRHELGLSNFMVGVVVGVQFLTTVITRGFIGRMADEKGGKRCKVQGIIVSSVAGLAYILAVVLPVAMPVRLAILIIGRVLLGLGESQLMSGNFTWALGLLGPARSGRIMSWNGMAIYGSLAAGAPIGLVLYKHFGFLSLGMATLFLPVISFLLDWRIPKVDPLPGDRLPLSRIIGFIWLPGLALALQGTGFALIGTFVSLYFRDQGWGNAGFALTCFGGAYVLMRVFFGQLPDRLGGIRITCVSMAVEMLGLLVLWASTSPLMALLGATLTGIGCSLIFPSLGVEIVKRVPPQARGTALGGYAAFQDISYAFTGPITGIVATMLGYSSVFAIGAACAASGIGVVLWFARTR
ncbi:MFS transporter [Oxalobacter sp. OttesenSCG-928-P03]|nr:MFS transporter [Oxalobacter sp. OttesenSCG-928-P03]